METHLADWVKDTPQGIEADAILRKCVHCGFCLATCPTYDLLGDELDSPRGRIYLMKQALEGAPVTERTRLHLDRCLTCRACETTCPSGVKYGRLVDIGRELVEEHVPRGAAETAKRWAIRRSLLSRPLFGAALALGRLVRGVLPAALARRIPAARPAGAWPAARHERRMLVLHGCVQPALAPSIDAAAARVLDHAGVSLVRVAGGGCCGGVSHHMTANAEALDYVKANIDAWWPAIEAGAEAIVSTASGCTTMLADYGHLLRGDPAYAAKAARVTELARDISQVVAGEARALDPLLAAGSPDAGTIAFHAPCSLQHGLAIRGVVERLLRQAGYQLSAVPDGHLCCGSAGTYSMLQPALSRELLANKVRALESGAPAAIATANIGCLTHIASATALPIRHWVELLDERLQRR